MMKKILAIAMAIVMVLSLTSCVYTQEDYDEAVKAAYDEGHEAGYEACMHEIEDSPDYDTDSAAEDVYKEIQDLVTDETDYYTAIKWFNWMQDSMVFYPEGSTTFHRITCSELDGKTFHVTFTNGTDFERLSPHLECCGDYEYGIED